MEIISLSLPMKVRLEAMVLYAATMGFMMVNAELGRLSRQSQTHLWSHVGPAPPPAAPP